MRVSVHNLNSLTVYGATRPYPRQFFEKVGLKTFNDDVGSAKMEELFVCKTKLETKA